MFRFGSNVILEGGFAATSVSRVVKLFPSAIGRVTGTTKRQMDFPEDQAMIGTEQKQVEVPRGYKGRQPHPDRQTTVILKDVFVSIQGIQANIHRDGNLPKIDHGMLTSAALELALEMDNVEERIIERALQITLRRRRNFDAC